MGLPRRLLGKTGLEVSLLALGLVKIGRNTSVKYPEAFDLPDDDQVIALLQQAHRLGINLLDTAPAYGTSEARLGKALQALPRLASDFLLSTKAGESFVDGQSHFDFSADAIRGSVENSLTLLGRSCLDLVLVHSNGADLKVLEEHEPLATLQAMQDEGIIRACGFSGKTVAGGERALSLGADALMLTLNETDTSELPLLEAAQRYRAGVLVKKPLASGYGRTETLRRTAGYEQVTSMVVGTLSPIHLSENALALAGS